MRRVLPHPMLSGVLLVLWLLLNQSLSPAQALIGSLTAMVAGLTFASLVTGSSHMRRPAMIIQLVSRVVSDIVRSNYAVAQIILGVRRRARRSGFVNIPLDLRDAYGLAALACIITSTPGTLWVELDRASSTLTIHVLDLVDEEEWVRTIKARYETPLLEIFA